MPQHYIKTIIYLHFNLKLFLHWIFVLLFFSGEWSYLSCAIMCLVCALRDSNKCLTRERVEREHSSSSTQKLFWIWARSDIQSKLIQCYGSIIPQFEYVNTELLLFFTAQAQPEAKFKLCKQWRNTFRQISKHALLIKG